jgi:hypothetical protein
MLQKRKRTAKALARADIEFIIAATLETFPPAKRLKNLAMIMNTGFPGGWPTSILKAEEINSLQSHRLVVGSIVIKKVKAAIAKATQPVILLIRVYFFTLFIYVIMDK